MQHEYYDGEVTDVIGIDEALEGEADRECRAWCSATGSTISPISAVEDPCEGGVEGALLKLNRVTHPMTIMAERSFHWLKHCVDEIPQYM